MNWLSESFINVTLQFVAIFLQFPVISGILLCILFGNLAVSILKPTLFLLSFAFRWRKIRLYACAIAYLYAIGWIRERKRLSLNYAGRPPEPKFMDIVKQMSSLAGELNRRPNPQLDQLLEGLSGMPTGLWVDVGAGVEIKTGYWPRVRGYKSQGVELNRKDKLIL